jgi:large conductance mechanosensitive channel
MLKEFRAFIARGNVLDLAVAVIIGAAFSKIVTSLTEDVLMPVIGRVFGGLDFSSYFITLGKVPPNLVGSTDYVALKKAGVPLLGYGAFITQAVNFVIVAFIIFMLMRTVNRAVAMFEHEKKKSAEEPKAEPADVALLREIRDELKARPRSKPGAADGKDRRAAIRRRPSPPPSHRQGWCRRGSAPSRPARGPWRGGSRNPPRSCNRGTGDTRSG